LSEATAKFLIFQRKTITRKRGRANRCKTKGDSLRGVKRVMREAQRRENETTILTLKRGRVEGGKRGETSFVCVMGCQKRRPGPKEAPESTNVVIGNHYFGGALC